MIHKFNNMYNKAKVILSDFVSSFDKEDSASPVGLNALGLRVEYLDKVYKNHFSNHRFSGTILSPVEESPFFLT